MLMNIFSLVQSLKFNRQRVFDRFKNRENSFFDKLDDDLFMDLYATKEYAHKIHLLATKWGIGTIKQELWRSHSNFLQRIIDNVAFNSHGWAVRELKAYLGGEEDLSKSGNKAAKRIIREATRPRHSMQMNPASVLASPHDGNGYGSSVFPLPSADATNASSPWETWAFWRCLFQMQPNWSHGSQLPLLHGTESGQWWGKEAFQKRKKRMILCVFEFAKCCMKYCLHSILLYF